MEPVGNHWPILPEPPSAVAVVEMNGGGVADSNPVDTTPVYRNPPGLIMDEMKWIDMGSPSSLEIG
jgi:hypothetical protein